MSALGNAFAAVTLAIAVGLVINQAGQGERPRLAVSIPPLGEPWTGVRPTRVICGWLRECVSGFR